MHNSYVPELDDDLSGLDFSNLQPYPYKLFSKLNDDQQKIFEKLLGKKPGENFDIVKELSGIIKPFNGFMQSQLTYKEILKKITDHYGIRTSHTDAKKIEEEILIFKFKENFDKLCPEDKARFQQELNKVLESKNLKGSQLASLGTVGALALAELSGFGLYIMASTFVGSISSLFGLGLGFSFYTGMSTFLAAVTGPIGWLVGLGALAYTVRNESLNSISKKIKATLNASKSLVKGNYELATIVVVQICAIRLLLNQEKNTEIEKLTYQVSQGLKRKEEFKSKAYIVEMQLKRILEEKRNLDQEVQVLSSEIRNDEDAIRKLKEQLI